LQSFVTPISKGQFRKSASQNIEMGNQHFRQRKSSTFNKDDSGSDQHGRKDGAQGGDNFSDRIRDMHDKNSEKGPDNAGWRSIADTKNFRDLKDGSHGESAPVINIISNSNTSFDGKNNVFVKSWNKQNTFTIAEKPALARIDEENSCGGKFQRIISPNPKHADSMQKIQENESLMRSLGYIDWKSPLASKARGDIKIDVQSPENTGKTPGFAESSVINGHEGIVVSDKRIHLVGGNPLGHQNSIMVSMDEDIAEEFFNNSPIPDPEVFGESGYEKLTIG
jgi:hypothetical protein